MKIYITLGQDHIHKVGGMVYDKDCVVVIEAEDEESGRQIAFDNFGKKWFTSYTENNWDETKLRYYPRGYKEL